MAAAAETEKTFNEMAELRKPIQRMKGQSKWTPCKGQGNGESAAGPAQGGLLPQALLPVASSTPDGRRFSVDSKLGKCSEALPGDNCARGFHLCTTVGLSQAALGHVRIMRTVKGAPFLSKKKHESRATRGDRAWRTLCRTLDIGQETQPHRNHRQHGHTRPRRMQQVPFHKKNGQLDHTQTRC